MSAQLIGQIVLWLIVAIIVIAIAVYLMNWLYQRSSKETSFVRTGFLGEKVVINGGAFVIPIVHDVTPVNMNVLQLEIVREKDGALITADRMRVDVVAEFYVRVAPKVEAVSLAAATLGKRTMAQERLHELLAGKFISALRAVAAGMTLEEMHEQRSDYVSQVAALTYDALSQNGLEVESVAITDLDQTDLEYFNPSNRFDAEGLTKLIEEIESRRKLRNDIEQESMIKIRTRNLAAEREALDIDRESEIARLEQERELEARRAAQRAEVTRQRVSRETEAEQAQIEAREQTEKARIEQERAIAEARITNEEDTQRREIERAKSIEAAEISARQATEKARIEQERAIAEARIENEKATQQRDIERARAIEASEIAAREASERARIEQEGAVNQARIENEEQTQRRDIERSQTLEAAEIAAREATERARLEQERAVNEARIVNEEETQRRDIERAQAIEAAEISAREATEAARIAQEGRIEAQRIAFEQATRERDLARTDALETTEIALHDKLERARVAADSALQRERIEAEQVRAVLATQSRTSVAVAEHDHDITLAAKEVERTAADRARRHAEITANVEVEKVNVEQDRELEAARVQRRRALELLEVARTQALEEAQIESQEEIERARIAVDRGLDEARVGRQRDLRRLEIESEETLETAELDKAIVLYLKSKEQAEAQALADAARALAVRAEEEVLTARDKAVAERRREVEVALARKEAEQVRIAAEADQVRAVVQAEAQRLANEAENVLTDEARLSIYRRALLARIEGIVRESVKPMEKIDGINILHVDGIGQGGAGRNMTDEVIDSALRYRVQAPMIDSLLADIGMAGGPLTKMGGLIREARDMESLRRGVRSTEEASSKPADSESTQSQ
ncbi:MAG: flotillin family protein [Gammaproteobacteria bacterium]|nr:flotillin family protein [Gammaproteobacteria bacterium]NKC11670.1 flotillin family protein [Gammaproteobacteria bacterium]